MNCCRSIPPSEYSHAGAYRDGREAPRSDALGEKSGPIPPDMDLPWTMVREKLVKGYPTSKPVESTVLSRYPSRKRKFYYPY